MVENSVELRKTIYYWKCDRPAAFHGVLKQSPDELSDEEMLAALRPLLQPAFPSLADLRALPRKGNHRTFRFRDGTRECFVRVEDGPEGDARLDVESEVLRRVAATGVPVPGVYFSDATRSRVPFAVQVIEHYEVSDLGQLQRQGQLNLVPLLQEIGRQVARWQEVRGRGFGPLGHGLSAQDESTWVGLHDAYRDYFFLRLDHHLKLLEEHQFLSPAQTSGIRQTMENHAGLLQAAEGCLVHKDLALWNILGTADRLVAFIDWDDAILGDATDDLSLTACFHEPGEVRAAVSGYAEIRELPGDFAARFHLHWLRNMIVKSVIRCGAGYFTEGTGSFLVPPGQTVEQFRDSTRERLLRAWRALNENRDLMDL